jgi:hypothetical protein
MADYVGANLFNQDEIEDIANRMKNLSDYMQSRGGEFMVYVSPNKSRIYPEYMSEIYGEISSSNMAMQLQDYFQKQMASVKYMYHPEDFYKAKRWGYPLYMKGDTHWNGLGAYVAFERIMNTSTEQFTPLDTLEFNTQQRATADLANMLPLRDYNGGAYIEVSNYKPEIQLEDVKMVNNGNSLWRIHSNNNNGKKLLIYGDSFTPSLKNYLAKEYEETVIVNRWYKDMNQQLIDEENPDTVLIHRVERGVAGFPVELATWGVPAEKLLTTNGQGVTMLLAKDNTGKVEVSCEYGLAPYINWYNGVDTNFVLYAKDRMGEYKLWQQSLQEGQRYTMGTAIDTSSFTGDVSFYFEQEFLNGEPTTWIKDVTINDLRFIMQ